MNRKPKTTQTANTSQTALQAFDAHKAKILKMLAQLPAQVEMYDLEKSSAPDGPFDWSHAGTMAHVSEQVEAALQSVLDAIVATREKARRRQSTAAFHGDVTRSDGRRVRACVPSKQVRS